MEFTDVNETFLNKFTVLDANMGAGKTYNVAEFVRGPRRGYHSKSVIATFQVVSRCHA
jgi:hypothetical protein